jgi:phytanoyl-CoA hydroxylase
MSITDIQKPRLTMNIFLDALNADGYCVIPQSVNGDLISNALRQVNDLKRLQETRTKHASDEIGRLYRIINLHLGLDSFEYLFADNKALDVCDQFFKASTALYTTLYFEKGSEQDLHRDSPYFCTNPPGQYLGVWLALDDVDAENGPLVVIPGSHLLPRLDLQSLRKHIFGDEPAPAHGDAGWLGYQAAVSQQCDEHGLKAREVHVKRGDTIIWHPELMHGGAHHIHPTRTRCSLVMHVTPHGMPVHHMDVFYGSSKPMLTAPWKYKSTQNSRFVSMSDGVVGFGHSHVVSANLVAQDLQIRNGFLARTLAFIRGG